MFQYFLFQFIELIFSKVYKQSKGRLVDVFCGSSENFGKDTFNFLSSLRNDLTKSLFDNVVDVSCCCFNYPGGNFSSLVNSISTSIGKIKSIKKSAKLSFSSILSTSPSFLFYPFFWRYMLNFLSFLVQSKENREACFY